MQFQRCENFLKRKENKISVLPGQSCRMNFPTGKDEACNAEWRGVGRVSDPPQRDRELEFYNLPLPGKAPDEGTTLAMQIPGNAQPGTAVLVGDRNRRH